MARRKRHTPEQIIGLLRAIEVAVAQGRMVADTCREHAISEQTYYRWLLPLAGRVWRPEAGSGQAAQGT